MKIIRKKSVKKFKIEHNRKLFWIIILLLVLFGFLIWIIVKDREEVVDIVSGDICMSDNDCVKVQTTCCSCKMGGEEKCVFKSREQEYSDKLNECSKDLFCAAVYNCKISSCKCINNQCVGK